MLTALQYLQFPFKNTFYSLYFASLVHYLNSGGTGGKKGGNALTYEAASHGANSTAKRKAQREMQRLNKARREMGV